MASFDEDFMLGLDNAPGETEDSYNSTSAPGQSQPGNYASQPGQASGSIVDPATEHLVPSKSLSKYMTAYHQFSNWRSQNNVTTLSEGIFLNYFEEMSKTLAPPTLWARYSMLKSTLLIEESFDIGNFKELTAFLKQASNGYRSKKSKTLSEADVERFLKEADDDKYLAAKVILIFGILGGCKREEITNIKKDDVVVHDSLILVKIPNSKSKRPRLFTIDGEYMDIVMKYRALRPQKEVNNRFFLNYKYGRCTVQPIGINTIGAMPRVIAEYLKLPDANMYTGHSFRSSSASFLAASASHSRHPKRPRSTSSPANVEDNKDPFESIEEENSVLSTEEVYVKQENFESSDTEPDFDADFAKRQKLDGSDNIEVIKRKNNIFYLKNCTVYIN